MEKKPMGRAVCRERAETIGYAERTAKTETDTTTGHAESTADEQEAHVEKLP